MKEKATGKNGAKRANLAQKQAKRGRFAASVAYGRLLPKPLFFFSLRRFSGCLTMLCTAAVQRLKFATKPNGLCLLWAVYSDTAAVQRVAVRGEVVEGEWVGACPAVQREKTRFWGAQGSRQGTSHPSEPKPFAGDPGREQGDEKTENQGIGGWGWGERIGSQVFHGIIVRRRGVIICKAMQWGRRGLRHQSRGGEQRD